MDRQDIDALLIGALYGELTPADEARLAAHLDSHPTDRGALDDLKSARRAVRESRIFELQLDPPQAVSALLLQEAHRRAPKRVVRQDDEKESWFFRFTKMFLAHPAMAAAAMLVLVVGVASMLYVRKGDRAAGDHALTAAQPEVMQTAEEPNRSADTTALSKNELAQAPQEIAAGSAAADDRYRVDLADTDEGNPTDSKGGRGDAERALERQENKKKSGALVVTTPRPEPKELDEASRTKVAGAKKTETAKESLDFESSLSADGNRDAITSNAATGTATASAGPAPGAASGRATTPPRNAPAQGAQPQPPPPPTVATKPATTAPAAPKPAPPAKVATEKPAEAKQDAAPAKDTSLIAWAKGEHKRALNLARTNCPAAAKVVLAIQNRAPDYFAKEVATDRGLKNCQTYINEERNAEAERANKSRAQKRPNANEPASESVR